MITEAVNKRVSSQIRYVTPVRQSSLTGTAELYQQIKQDFMPVPLLMLHSPEPDTLAGVWSILRESLYSANIIARRLRLGQRERRGRQRLRRLRLYSRTRR